MRRAFARLNADLFHIIWVPRSFQEVLAARLVQPKGVVVSYHMPWPWRTFTGQMLNLLTYVMADRVVGVSNMVIRNLVRGGMRPAKTERIYQGVELDRFDRPGLREQGRAALSLHETTEVVGIVSHLWGGKGIDIFLRAAATLAGSRPNVRFLVVGEGPERDNLANLATKLGIAERVIFTGMRKDIPAMFAAMDVTVFSSHAESLGMVAAEAMAAGRPVVSTRSGGPEEIVADGETGFLVPCGDAEAIGHAVLELLRDPDLRARMGVAGTERAARQFSAERMAAAYEKLYREILGASDRNGRH